MSASRGSAPAPAFGPILVGVVLVAAWLRLQHCYAGLPYLHVWDEPQTASNALQMLRSGDFDPHFFNYGTLMTYVSLLVDVVHALTLLGLPPRAPEALGAVGNISINADTGWHWTISHPSFYFWNRVVVAAMGAGTVAMVGLIGRRVAGPLAGICGAVLLAGASVPIAQSAVITNDAPLAFFVMVAALGALVLLDTGRPAGLVLSLVSVGLAVGCKYTAGIALILPWTAAGLVALRPGPALPGWVWPALLLLPGGVFLVTTPYAVLDLPEFLNHVGYEIRHYRVLGHGTSTVTPGWPNLKIQLSAIYDCLGLVPCAFAVVGLLTSWRRHGWIVWVFPVVYGAYMSNTRIDFARNFLVLYPFVALAAGCAVAAVSARLHGRARTLGGGMLVAACVPWLTAPVFDALSARRPETRTEITRLLVSERWERIGIPEELRIHDLDLRRLHRKDVRVAPLRELLCSTDREVVVVPERFRSEVDPLTAVALTALLPPMENALVHGAPGVSDFWLDRPTVNPRLSVVRPHSSGGVCDGFVIRAAEVVNEPGFLAGPDGLNVTTTGLLTTQPRPLGAGRWSASWVLRGPYVGDEPPRVALGARSNDSLLTTAGASVGEGWAATVFPFELSEPGDLTLSFDFVNDAVVGGRDRNVEIAGVVVTPL